MARGSSAQLLSSPVASRNTQALESHDLARPAISQLIDIFSETLGWPRVRTISVWSRNRDPLEWEANHPGVFAFYNWKEEMITFSPYYTELMIKMAAGETTPEENFAAVHILIHELYHSMSGASETEWRKDSDYVSNVSDDSLIENAFEEGLVEALARFDTQKVAKLAGLETRPAFLNDQSNSFTPVYSKLGPYPLQSRMMLSLAELSMGTLDLSALAEGGYDDVSTLGSQDARAQLRSWLGRAPNHARFQAIRGHLAIGTGSSDAEIGTMVKSLHEALREPRYHWSVEPRKYRKGFHYNSPEESFNAKLAQTLAAFSSQG